MNEYVLHEQLLAMEGILAEYDAAEGLRLQVRQTVERLKSQLYRVAVIGEFKRGKSSLVNAIIGAQVLPTDILPMTAAVTRVTYGEKRKITIHFKDGSVQERSVEELIDFATKFDAQKEQTALTIREIEVCYPSVFCKHHIDILDTPGLNDNASMTQVTLGVLGEVDAALMVISANAPLSLTEQNLILTLIRTPGIRHIIFAVTHIDAVSNRVARQNKVLDFIRNRIQTDLWDAAREQFAQDPQLLQKAETILSQPDIYGVSSVLALEGFLHDDEQMLEDSRFPLFKNELLALLTAAQSSDIQAQTLELACKLCKELPLWNESQLQQFASQKQKLEENLESLYQFRTGSLQELEVLLKDLQEQLTDMGLAPQDILPSLAAELARPFIAHLSSIHAQYNSHSAVADALQAGKVQALDVSQELILEIQEAVYAALANTVKKFLALHPADCFRETPFSEDFASLLSGIAFPQFTWTVDPVPAFPDLMQVHVMPYVHKAISGSLEDLFLRLQDYIRVFEDAMLDQNRQDRENTQPETRLKQELSRLEIHAEVLRQRHQLSRQKLAQVCAALELPFDEKGGNV